MSMRDAMLTGVPPMPAPGRARRLQETIIAAAEDDVTRLADAVTRILEGETGAGTEQMIVVMIPLAKHELRDAVGDVLDDVRCMAGQAVRLHQYDLHEDEDFAAWNARCDEALADVDRTRYEECVREHLSVDLEGAFA